MNNYHIYEEVGKGKFSTVYKGRKKKSIEYVAVKSLEKSRRKKVLNEVPQYLPQPKLTRNHLWIIFEYCAGGDLLQLIEQDKALPEMTVKAFGKDLVNGLLYLHSHGIIYCDLKPSNVLMNEYGTLKLSDFGLAKKIVDLIQTSEVKGESGPKKGTPYYMAPELFQDEGVHSFASDFWALGCVLYELATGKPPFTSSSFHELVGLILNSEVPFVDKFSKDFNDLLQRLLEKDPSKRIDWDTLVLHPFWLPYEFPTATFPPQPHFESYLRLKGLIPKSGASGGSKERDKSPTPSQRLTTTTSYPTIESQGQKDHGTTSAVQLKRGTVDVVRLSQNILKNMIKEAQLNQGYENKENKDVNSTNDVKLTNKDQELNFGGNDEDEEEETSENNTGNSEQTQEDTQPEEEKTLEKDVTKIDFHKKTSTTLKTDASTLSNKTVTRHLKPEVDEMSGVSVTPKNTRSNSNIMEDAEKLATANFLTHQKSQTHTNPPSSATGSKKIPPVDQLLTHTSDTVVKPITGNKEIEKPYDSTFNKDLLPFPALAPEDVIKGVDSPQIENHLAEIYNYTASSTPNVLDKLNALSYFETIIQNSGVANRLVNSAFMNLLVKLTKNSKNGSLRVKVCTIIGHLIRHATVIENELSQLGIPAVMADALKDKSEKVRRKAIAALGEYLFYGATQMDEDSSNSVWELSPAMVSLLLKTIQSKEDEIVIFYACKTVENITAQSINAGTKFASYDFVTAFHAIYTTTKNEALKICAVVCLGHIARLNGSLIWKIIEKISVRHICSSFSESHARIQQTFITLLNQLLYTGGNKVYTFLAEEKNLIPSLISLLEHSSVVIRGKCLLTFYLMFKTNLKWMMSIAENKFASLLDKLSRDTYRYVQCCLIHLLDLVTELIPIILSNIQEELSSLIKKHEMNNDGSHSPKEYVTNYTGLMPIILGVMNSSLLRKEIVKTQFLLTMFDIYDLSEATKGILSDDLRTTVFMIFEGFSSNHKLLHSHHDTVLKTFFPNLLSKIRSKNADSRFNGLKLITDIMIQYLNEPEIYDPSGSTPSSKIINDIIIKELLPNIGFILEDQEPMPLYGLKLFSIVFGKNINFIRTLKQKKMLGLFLQYFTCHNPRLTSNTLKIIVKIVECREVTLDELSSVNFLSNAIDILKDFSSHQQEWCYEELLDILSNYLYKILEALKDLKVNVQNLDNVYSPVVITDPQASSILKQNSSFLGLLDILVSLVGHIEPIIAERSLQCLLLVLYIFGSQKKDKTIIKPDQTASILNILSQQQKQNLWRKAAKCLLWFAYIQDGQLYIPSDKKGLVNLLERYKTSDDKTLSYCCKELKSCIKY